MESLSELLAADGTLLVHVVLELVVAIALRAEDQMLARLNHD